MSTRPSNDDERLPWLTSEPARALAPTPPRERRGVPWLALALIAVLSLLAGAFWLGRQTVGPPTASHATARMPIDAVPPNVPEPTPVPDQGELRATAAPAEVTAPVEAPTPTVAPPAPVAVEQPPSVRPTAPAPRTSIQRTTSRWTQHRAAPARHRTIVKAPPRPVAPLPSVVAARSKPPTARPSRYGYWPNLPTATALRRVIQIGAYSTRRSTDYAWRWAIYRYPQLCGLPKVVAPYVASDGKQYYRLQLITTAPAQSKWLCRKMRHDRRSCIVIR